MRKSYRKASAFLSVIIIFFLLHHKNFSNFLPFGLARNIPTMDNDPYIITTNKLPQNSRFNPTISNGYLGHAVYSDTIYKNGLYNGEKGDCHRARIPGTLPYLDMSNVPLMSDDDSLKISGRYILDMRYGIFSQVFDIENKYSGSVVVSQNFYAHRLLTRILVTQITVLFKASGSITIPFDSSSGDPSNDIRFANWVTDGTKKHTCGITLTPEQPGSKVLQVCIFTDDFPKQISIDGSPGSVHKYVYITSIGDNWEEARDFYEIASKMYKNGTLESSHKQQWQEIWDFGSVTLKSEDTFYTSSVVSGIYYLLSAFPSFSFDTYPYEFFGVSPGGLTNGGQDQDYLGHVFWDQDFWMLPALLPLFPNTVQHGLKYRISRLSAAKAKASEFGCKGALYPWESAYSGADVCPGEKYVKYEQHVTGDLIHTLKQYIFATNNWDFLLENIKAFPQQNTTYTAWDLVYETAKFWSSRSVWCVSKSKYVIDNVMGPDEYHAPVNNSAFTNVVAIENIKFALRAAEILKLSIPEKDTFQNIVENIFVPYDGNIDFHPEFEGFDPKNDTVKQADTIMLGFPLMHDNNKSTRLNDLGIYSQVTDPEGPAMTWSMFCINYNDVGKYSEADSYFLRQHNNIQLPFQIWAEEPDGQGAVNFLTGIGGYIQSLIYGYMNLRIYEKYMTLSPRLPPPLTAPVSQMKLSGLKFQGVILNVIVASEFYEVTLEGFSVKNKLYITIRAEDRDNFLFDIGDSVTVPVKHRSRIMVSLMSD